MACVRLVFRLLIRDVILRIMLLITLGVSLACLTSLCRRFAMRLRVDRERSLFPGEVPF